MGFLRASSGGNPQVTVPLVRTSPIWGNCSKEKGQLTWPLLKETGDDSSELKSRVGFQIDLS